jgi:hypothetical protein
MQYANQYGYSDVNPFEVVRVVSDKCIEVRAMGAERDPNGPELIFNVGGFAANCPNQRDQKWIISSDESNPVVRLRLRKNGYYGSPKVSGKFALSNQPIKFYDYNF